MNVKANSFRSPLGKVRGLGSAKNGTGHWIAQRFTAVILILTVALLFYKFMTHVVLGNFDSAAHWLNSSLSGSIAILFLIACFYHAALGLQVIIEDYVRNHAVKFATLLTVRFILGIFFVAGIVSVIRIQLMDL